MDYLTNYYRNLCEQLQEKVDLLEAGLKKALRTGDPNLLAREGVKAALRSQRPASPEHLEKVEDSGMQSMQAIRRYGPASRQAGISSMRHANMIDSLINREKNLRGNLVNTGEQLSSINPELYSKTVKNYITPEIVDSTSSNPDRFDGPDEDDKASAEEVASAQAEIQMSGHFRPFLTPEQMAKNLWAGIKNK
jgi:hypothetical protein